MWIVIKGVVKCASVPKEILGFVTSLCCFEVEVEGSAFGSTGSKVVDFSPKMRYRVSLCSHVLLSPFPRKRLYSF